MRALSLCATVVATLLLAVACSASLLPRGAQMPQPMAVDMRGAGYGLVMRLAAALHFKNYTMAGMLLADDGMFRVTDYSCGWMNKTQFMMLVMNENIAADQVIPRTWVEAQNTTIISAEVGALFVATSPLANMTYYNPYVYLVANPTADGSQLMMFARYTDRSAQQLNNASQMVQTWKALRDASVVGDIEPWRRMTTDMFMFGRAYRFDEKMPVMLNKTMFLAGQADTFKRQMTVQVMEDAVFPVCDLVLAEYFAFVTDKDGMKHVQKFFTALVFEEGTSMLKGLDEYSIGFEDRKMM